MAPGLLGPGGQAPRRKGPCCSHTCGCRGLGPTRCWTVPSPLAPLHCRPLLEDPCPRGLPTVVSGPRSPARDPLLPCARPAWRAGSSLVAGPLRPSPAPSAPRPHCPAFYSQFKPVLSSPRAGRGTFVVLKPRDSSPPVFGLARCREGLGALGLWGTSPAPSFFRTSCRRAWPDSDRRACIGAGP